MRLRMRHLQEERIVFLTQDEVNRPLGKLSRQIRLIAERIDDLLVFIKWQRAKVKDRPLLRMVRPHVI